MKKTQAIYARAIVISCKNIASDVWELVMCANCPKPKAGQFFMLRAQPSAVLLGRPISVYYTEARHDTIPSSFSPHTEPLHTDNSCTQHIHFLILQKGQGTAELCALKKGDSLEFLGPLGNTFTLPHTQSVAIIGGGIGIAPVAGFATSLPAKTYDFYACFKSGSYALDYLHAKNLIVTTDDGSCGTKGMLPCVLHTDTILKKNYKTIYACGPQPMLAYIQKICTELRIQCFLSVESHMACGVGACLGCTVKTTEGNKRCCKDGPIFDSAIIEF